MLDPFRRIVFYRRVAVNLDDGTTIAGVFWRTAGPLIVLKEASLLRPSAEAIPLDGEVIIERSRVVFIQAP